MDDAPQQSTDVEGDREEPRSIEEGFRRINRSVEQVSEIARLVQGHPRLEYDQGDGLSMEYDDAYDLASGFWAAFRVARETESALSTTEAALAESRGEVERLRVALERCIDTAAELRRGIKPATAEERAEKAERSAEKAWDQVDDISTDNMQRLFPKLAAAEAVVGLAGQLGDANACGILYMESGIWKDLSEALATYSKATGPREDENA